jgi:hypothetical protein
MVLSVFEDKSKEPTASEFRNALGDAAFFLNDIEQHLNQQYGSVNPEWKFYSKKAGWTLALKHKDRTVFHLLPGSGVFTVVFVLGKRAVLAAQRSKLPGGIISAIENAREYIEGRSIRFEVATLKDVSTVKQLIEIKMAN